MSEAIASGAFWFYRKLGFRPVGEKAERLLAIEDRRIRERPRLPHPGRDPAQVRDGPASLRRQAC